jgi:hypothetical protein
VTATPPKFQRFRLADATHVSVPLCKTCRDSCLQSSNLAVYEILAMHLRQIWVLVVLILGGLSAQAQSFPILRWQKFYGSEYDDVPARILKAPDGNLFIGGSRGTDKGSNSCQDVWVMKVDTLGKLLWERPFGGAGCDELRDMVVTPDSGVIFVGTTNSFIEHPEKGQPEYQGDYFVGKVTKEGDIEWLKTFGGLDVDQAYSIVRSETWPEYLVAGVSNSQNFDVETDFR